MIDGSRRVASPEDKGELWLNGEAQQRPVVAGASQSPLHASGEILVQFAVGSDSAARQAAIGSVGGAVVELVRGGPEAAAGATLVRVKVGNGLSVEQAIEIVSKRPGVSFAEPNYIYTIEAASNDPGYTGGALWGMYGDQTSPANQYGSQAGEAWAAGRTGSFKVVVGVIDTGIDYTHPDLYLNIWLNKAEIPTAIRNALVDADGDGLITFRDLNASQNAPLVADWNQNGRIDAGDLLHDMSGWEDGADNDGNGYVDDLIGWDFVNNDNDPYDDNNHGTHVAGTIAGLGGNGAGVAGVAWTSQLIALKFLSASGSGSTADAIKAIDYYTAASAAASSTITGEDFAATNNSWGGGGFSQALLDAIVRGAKGDILFVAAAGNGGSDSSGDDNDSSPYYPSSYDTTALAGYDAVIAVASITSSGSLSSFSNFGSASVELGAPGSSIYSTVAGGGYATYSGTSMATPHVTGAIALYSALSGADASTIRAHLLNSTIATASLDGKTMTGGRLDAATFAAAATGGGFDITGGLGNDVLSGGSGADVFRLYKGGNDTVYGLGGRDIIYFGAAFTAADTVDGGDGYDSLVLQGDYSAGVTFGTGAISNISGIESISLLSGSATNFGDNAGNSYSYNLTVVDANLAAGGILKISAAHLRVNENLTFNGSAETNGTFLVYAGSGTDLLTGGALGDSFVFILGRFNPGDKVNGGAGHDVVYLRGNYTIDFRSADYSGAFTAVESLQLHSASDTTHASGDGSEFDYSIVWDDDVLAAGATITINGAKLMSSETLSFDGSDETNGRFRLFGGAADDTLTGGGGNDIIIYGGLGADTLRGGAGSDMFSFYSTAESTLGSFDRILDFSAGTDKIDLTRIDSNPSLEGNQAFSFIGSQQFTGSGDASAGQLRAEQIDSVNNVWKVEGDVNGDGVADLLIEVTLEAGQQLAASDFYL